MGFRDILLIGAVGISLPICFLRPAYGIVLFTLLGFLNPQWFTYGIARDLELALPVAVATIAGFCATGRFRSIMCKEALLLGILWLWFTITTLNSVHTPSFVENADRTWYRWSLVSKILLITLVTIGVMYSRSRLRWLFLSIGGSFALLVFHSLPGMILSGGEFRVYGPENSMIANNNTFGLAVNMALPFFFFLARTESKRFVQIMFGAAFVLGIVVSFFTYSRGAFVGLIALAAAMLLRSKQKLLLIPVVILALLFGAFVAPQKWRNRISETTDTSEASAKSRLNSWAYSWNLVNDYPVTGGGFDAYSASLFARYAPDPQDVHGPHSIYFGVLLEHGFVGFFLYFLLMAYCLAVLHRIAKRSRLYGDQESSHYADMLTFSLVAFMTSGAFLSVAYFDFYFSLVACTAILHRLCREEWRANLDAEAHLETRDESALLPAV